MSLLFCSILLYSINCSFNVSGIQKWNAGCFPHQPPGVYGGLSHPGSRCALLNLNSIVILVWAPRRLRAGCAAVLLETSKKEKNSYFFCVCGALSVLYCRELQVINNSWKGRDTFMSMSNASVAQCYVCTAGQPSNLQIIGEIIQGPCLPIIQPPLLSKEDTHPSCLLLQTSAIYRLWFIADTHADQYCLQLWSKQATYWFELNFFTDFLPRFAQSESLDRNSPTCGYNLRGKSF